MAERYRLSRAGITSFTLTEAEARERFEHASENPGSDLVGDMENGFHYWSLNSQGEPMLRNHVLPLPDAPAEPDGPADAVGARPADGPWSATRLRVVPPSP
ncbi:MAG: hypothetical protein ACRDVE_19780 [Actinocrinis sp.]